MYWRRTICRLVVLLVLVISRKAQAARAYFDGTFQSLGTSCPVTGTAVIAAQSYTGYFTDPNEPFPMTGDVAYVHAVAANVSPCVNDAMGFEFFLPDGATFAVNGANQVLCYRGKVDGTFIENVPNASNSSCSQSPSPGSNGGSFFGYSALPPGWYIEILVPVTFNKKLLGIAGPNSHRLVVATSSAYGTMFPYQPVTTFYRSQFQNMASSAVTGGDANLAFDLLSYFASGQLYVDFGTTSAFGSSTSPASVPDTAGSFPINSTLTGLNPGTPYFWRARFVTSDGSFTSATQSFATSAAPTFALSVTKAGMGSGKVTTNPAGIDCGAACSASFAQGTNLSLTAVPSTDSTFAGWTGACTGTGACSVTMDAAKSVTASFDVVAPPQVGSLSLTVSGLPSGSSATLGITAPNGFNSTRTIVSGTGQTLSDVPIGVYAVTAANVTVGQSIYAPNAPSQNVNVNFGATATVDAVYAVTTVPMFALTVTKGGTGSGTVTSNPAGVNCGASCSAVFADGSSVGLMATADPGSNFAGWSDACSGAGTCTVTTNAAKTIGAIFTSSPATPEGGTPGAGGIGASEGGIGAPSEGGVGAPGDGGIGAHGDGGVGASSEASTGAASDAGSGGSSEAGRDGSAARADTGGAGESGSVTHVGTNDDAGAAKPSSGADNGTSCHCSLVGRARSIAAWPYAGLIVLTCWRRRRRTALLPNEVRS